MNRCAVFDLDGTLLNTLSTIAYHGNRTLKQFSLPELSLETYRKIVGNGARIQMQRMLRAVSYSGDDFETIYQAYLANYDEDVEYQTEPYPGIAELLAALKSGGFLLGVLSNKPNSAVQETIRRYFPHTFDAVSGAFEDLPKKPDPTLLNRMLKDLDADRSTSLYIGDTGCDMQTGKAAGLFTIGVLWGFRDKTELTGNHADAIVAHPSEIFMLG